MLNHKFYISDENKEDNNKYIRISNEFIEKMKADLLKFKFTWNDDILQYGLSSDFTIIKPDQLIQMKNCLLKQPEYGEEYYKFLRLINKALLEKVEIIHESGSPGHLVHDFVICSEFPRKIDYNNYKNQFIKIQDQFIMENFDVFDSVKLFWEDTNHLEEGFNYYGTTLINSEMALKLIHAMNNFLKNNDSEKAEYFIGEEYNKLTEILDMAISDFKVIIHFGI